MWKAKTKDGKEINEQNNSWVDVKNDISELSLVTKDNKIITLPKNMESYIQFKSASANLGSNNINIESRTIGFKLGNNIIKIRVDEKNWKYKFGNNMTYSSVWPLSQYDSINSGNTSNAIYESFSTTPYYYYESNTYTLNGDWSKGPVIVKDDSERDIIIIPQSNLTVTALRTENNGSYTKLWTSSIPRVSLTSTPTLSIYGNYILISGSDYSTAQNLYKIDIQTGEVSILITATGSMRFCYYSTGVGGTIYNYNPPSRVFTSSDGYLYMLAVDGTATEGGLWTTYLKLCKFNISGEYSYSVNTTGVSKGTYPWSGGTYGVSNPIILEFGNYIYISATIFASRNGANYSRDIVAVNKTNGASVYTQNTGLIDTYQMICNPNTVLPNGILYALSSTGIKSYNYILQEVGSHSSTSVSYCHPALNKSTGVLYYRANNILYAIKTENDGSLTELYRSNILPTGTHYAPIIIDKNGNIIVCSSISTTGVSNVHIFKDNGSFLNLEKSFRTFWGGVPNTPTIGGEEKLYITTTSPSFFYAYGAEYVTTTTTSTTTASPTTTTTTTTGTGPTTTTTTTTTPTTTTTTTTTTPAPLSIVQTTQFDAISLDNIIPIQSINASDDSSTQNALLSQSFSFGTIAPNQTSKTIIVQLNIPRVKAITNIKIGLISSGNIEFDNNIFGISKSVELRDDITPDDYFLGVNEDKLSTNIYNINVANKNDHTSEYVYLNINLPQNQSIGEGLIRYKWFFDYA